VRVNQGTVRINVRLKNQGTGAISGNIYAGLYIDTVPTGACNQTPTQILAWPPLAAGATSDVRYTFPDLGPFATPGEHTVYVVADYDCTYTESDETNNISDPVTFEVIQPDLTVTSLAVEPANPAVNAPVTMTMVVKNIGTDTSSGAWSGFYVDRDLPSPICTHPGDHVEQVPGLAAGASYTLTWATYFTTGGQHRVSAYADYGCNATESNESNNSYGPVYFDVHLPDLTVGSITASPENATVGQPVTFTVHITNTGYAASPTGGTLALYFDHTPAVQCGDAAWVNTKAIPALAPGESTDLVVQTMGFATEGFHLVYAYADYNCDVAEENEYNNELDKSVFASAAPLPDLAVASLVTDPASPPARELVTYTVRISNTGEADLHSISYAGIYLDRFPACGNLPDRGAEVPPLDIGESYTFTVTDTGFDIPGPHHVYAFADYGCGITETNESNNYFGPLEVNVGQPLLPDLVVEGITPDPAEPAAEEYVTYTVRVRNTGTDTAQVSSLAVYTDHVPSGCTDAGWANTADVPALAPGEAVSVTVFTYGFATRGNHEVYAYADLGCLREESNETNNAFGPVGVTVGPPLLPDLEVDSITPDPAEPPAREPVTFTVRVRNAGTADMTGVSSLAVYTDHVPSDCSDSDWANTAQIPPLATGAYTDVVVVTYGFATPGSYTVAAFADHTCLLREGHENNNQYVIGVDVGQPLLPDLAVTGLTTDPEDPPAREYVTYTVHISNTGTAPSPVEWVAVYTDHVPTCKDQNWANTAQVPSLNPGESADVAVPQIRYMTPGAKDVRAFVDFTCLTEELDETNNIYTATVTIGPPLLPDLIVTSVTTDPEDPAARQWITATVRVSNTGTARSSAVGLAVYTDTLPTGCGDPNWANASSVPALNPGESADVVVTAIRYMTSGSYPLYAFADDTCLEEELNETNNIYTKTLQIGPPLLPDLVVDSVTLDPAEPAARQPVVYTVSIRNAGTAEAHSYTWAGLYIDRTPAGCGGDIDIGDRVAQVPPLAVGASYEFTLTAPFDTEGSHTFSVFADYGCVVEESDKANNLYGPISVTVAPPLLPDLVVQSVTLNPAEPAADQWAQTVVTISNQGTAAASSWTWAGVYTDRVPSGCGGDIDIGDLVGHVPPLAIGESFVFTVSVKFPTEGAHTYAAYADYGCILEESNKANNLYGPISVTAGPPLLPDLVVDSVTADWTGRESGQSNPAAGQPVAYTVRIHNAGTAEARSYTWAGIYRDPDPAPACGDVGDVVAHVPPLGIGESYVFTLTTPFDTQGNHAVYTFLDYGCILTESDEDNNLYGPTAFQVGPPLQPDLAVMGITPNPAEPAAGQWVSYTVRISNTGTAAASGWGVALYADHVPATCDDQDWVNTAQVPALAPGAYADVAIPTYGFTTAQQGAHSIYALVDFTCLHAEVNEANNRYGPVSVSVGAPLQPDLAVQSVTVSPSQPGAGQPAQFIIRIRNQGTGDGQSYTYAGLYLDRTPAGCGGPVDVGDRVAQIPPLAVGASYVFTLTTPFATQGTHQAAVFLDYGCILAESNEANNRHGPFNVQVGPPQRPDLAVTSVTTSPSSPTTGQPVNFRVTVRNQGTDRAHSITYAGLYYDRVPAGCGGDIDIGDQGAQVPALDIGASFTFTVTKIFTSTTHTAYVFADYGCMLAEPNETNNQYGPITLGLKPANLPDLVVDSVLATPANPAAGEAVQVVVSLRNQGPAAMGAGAYAGLYADHAPACGDEPFVSAQVPSLTAGQSYVFTRTVSFPTAGQHEAYILADYTCAVTEVNDDNNVYGPVVFNPTTLQPDLEVAGITASPSILLVGQPVTYTVTVHNTGAVATNAAASVAIYSQGQPTTCGDTSWDNIGQVAPLAPGASRDVVIKDANGFPFPQNQSVYAFADYTCSITETDESNNVYGPVTVRVTDPLPDLSIDSVTADPTSIAEGQGVTLTVHVANGGNAAASSTSAVGVYVDQSVGYCHDPQPNGGWTTVSALPVGGSELLTIHVPAAAFDPDLRTHEIFLYENYSCSDPVRPQLLYDNDTYGPIEIGMVWPDLTVESLTVSPASPPAREPVTYTVRVRNSGAAATTTTVSLTIHAKDYNYVPSNCFDPSGDHVVAVPPLAAGAYADITIHNSNGLQTPGQYYIYAVVDADCQLFNKDSNLSNNIFGPQTVWVGQPLLPDLVIDSLTSYPANPAAGAAVHYVARVRNAGTAAMKTTGQVGIYRNRPVSYCGTPDLTASIAPLAVGATQDVTFEDTFGVAGWYYVSATADANCQIEETSEYNNDRGPVDIEVGEGLPPPTPTPTPSPGPTPTPTRLYAFVADGASGVRAVNVTDPQNPQLVSTMDTPGEANDVAVISPGGSGSGGVSSADGSETRPYYVLVADGSAGLQVINVADPANPLFVGTYDTPDDARSVAVSGNYAYVADGSAGLQVVDVSTPTAPKAPKTGGSFYDTSGTAYGVAISGTYAFVADGSPGLVVIDVSNPMTPTYVATYDTPGEARSVAIAASPATTPGHIWAYIADGSWGLHVVDVTDPAHPQFVTVSKTPGTALDVAVPGVGATGASQALTYLAANDKGLRLINPTIVSASAAACDTAGNCATAEPQPGAAAASADLPLRAGAVGRVPDWPRALAALQGSAVTPSFGTSSQAASLIVTFSSPPAVVDSTATVKVSGEAHALVSSLESLVVTADGATILNWSWLPGVVTDTLWSADWTPVGDGPHLIHATLTDQNGDSSDASLTVTVDAQPPAIAIAPTILTGSAYHEPHTLDLTGAVTDTAGVEKVEWRTATGGWQLATLDSGAAGATSDTWSAAWTLDEGALPDGASFTVGARATDLGGHATEISVPVTVDIVPPSAVDLSMTNGGNPVAPGGTADPAAGLTLAWDAASDGSGLGDYQVRWTAQVTESVIDETAAVIPAAGSLTSSYTPDEGSMVTAQLGSQDVYGQQRWQTFGPVYADGPLTPDYVWLGGGGSESKGGFETRPYCSLLGVDRRVALYAHGGAALSAEQRLYGTWNAEALRLTWTGADWNSDGDLFIYLDTVPGSGATTAFDPYPATAGQTVISLPSGMGADTLVWVRDGENALLLRWNGSDWDLVTALGEDEYRFDGAVNSGQTDLYIPFSLLDIADPASTSLDLLAFASEEDALRLWAVLPNTNPVNSALVIDAGAYTGDSQQFSLSQRYHWDAVGAGICPNGSLGGAATARYADTDVQVHLTASPAGATYSLIQDNLFWLQQLLLGTPPADVTSQLAFLAAGQPPVGPGQIISYTLTYRNRGSDTATGVTADVTAEYALRLSGGDGSNMTVALGDIAPGAEGTASFTAVVDTSRSSEPWAAVAVEIHDSAHPAGSEPIEWLWAHHRVDRSAPQFFGIQQPGYILGPGANTVSGYAYDESGVPLVSLEVQGGGTTDCPVTAPQSGQWSCAWNVGGSNGDILQVKLHASDSFGQEQAWSDPLPFIVDTEPPTITLDMTATGVISGSVVTNSGFPVYGDVADAGGVAQVDVCVDASCGQAALQLSGGQSAVTRDDVPDSPVAIGSSCVVRTFAVAEAFSVGQVSLGFAAEHPRRDELQVDLTSPAGTTVRALDDDGTSSVHYANYDVWLSDAASTALAASQGDHDPAAPYFDRSLRPYAPLLAFQGQTSQGNWTLTVCDRNASANDGTYLRGRLTLTPRDTSAKSGRWSFSQAQAASQQDYVERSLTVYAQDVVGNRTSDPLRLNVWVDNVSPAITVTAALASLPVGDVATVLSGTVTDGSPTADVSLRILAPDGTTTIEAAARDGGHWWYNLQPEQAGSYSLWAVATDEAGNTTTVGPYTVEATCTDAGLSAALISTEPAVGSPFSVTLTALISNTGTVAVAAGLPVAFSIGEKPIGYALTAQAIQPGQAVTVTLDWSVDFPGDYTINVVPNAGGAVQPLALCVQPAAAHRSITVGDLPLYQGWNLVSSVVDPLKPAVSTVQRPIAGAYFVIQGFDGGARSYYPSLPPEINTLKTLDAAHGYWVKTTLTATVPPGEDEPPVATLRLSGTRLPEDQPLALSAGWNLVSYLPQTALPVTVALASIAGKYTVVQGFDHGAQSFYPDLNPIFNTLLVMQPGMGYWIRTTQAVTLTYSSSAISTTVSAAGTRLLSISQPQISMRTFFIGQTGRTAPIRQVEHDAGVTPTNTWVDIYGEAIQGESAADAADGAPLLVGTVIKALDPQGIVCGATVVTTEGEYGLLACYGDDPDTPADEGAMAGDQIRLMVGEKVLGIGDWSGAGERQEVALGKVEQGEGPEGPGPLPTGQPPSRQWLPLVLDEGQD